ncbi:MAG: hypothetical protein M0R77_18530 [Gammaproteobacteria bacterium]|nr:hypothetical protein [Gammaproteobacteria bacterium]
MRSNEIKKLKEQIAFLTKKIEEDLILKSVKPGEIVLTDPTNDEVPVLQKADNEERIKILARIEDDIKDDEDLNEKSGYSAKSAHSGKDLGKPGKNFKKIADKAAKEYGSKEAGKRVAGVVLAKLRKESVDPSKALMLEGMEMALTGELDEKLKPSMGVGAYIDDFVHSKNKRFAGKSKAQRIKMAKGAYYGATKESVNEAGDEWYQKGYQHYKNGGEPRSPAFFGKMDSYHSFKKGFEAAKNEKPVNEAAEDSEHFVITPELMLRSMEWAKEDAGEDIQLHKYIEALSEMMATKDVLDSDDYEAIVSKVTPNDPNVNDNGPESPPEQESTY